VTALLCLAAPVACAEEPADVAPPAPDTPPAELLADARPEWLARTYIHVQTKYPDLSWPAVELINRKYPQFWAFATSKLDELAAAKDPGLQAQIRMEALSHLQRVAPALHDEVIDLIRARFPLLLDEIARIIRENPDTDPTPKIARLLREDFPTLLRHVQDEVLVRHPKVLSQIISAIAVKWPDLFGNVVKQIHKRFPNLARDVFALAEKKHPELPELAARLLRGERLQEENPLDEPPAEPPTEVPTEQGPPAPE
ncbi:MAG: hypothetical protein ACE5JM_17115, partial [Armatimonadota bacterium]